MRRQLNKLLKGNSTKAERRFAELLKQAHVPFRTKAIVSGREVDFLIGRTVIELDAHQQDVTKNSLLLEAGYEPIHFFNWEIGAHLIDWLKKLHGRYKSTNISRQ